MLQPPAFILRRKTYIVKYFDHQVTILQFQKEAVWNFMKTSSNWELSPQLQTPSIHSTGKPDRLIQEFWTLTKIQELGPLLRGCEVRSQVKKTLKLRYLNQLVVLGQLCWLQIEDRATETLLLVNFCSFCLPILASVQAVTNYRLFTKSAHSVLPLYILTAVWAVLKF